MRHFTINQVFDKKDKTLRFKSNQISTTKYTVLTFLPLNLMVQFSKMANFYFLILTLLELIPAINSPGGFITMLLPLMFVVSVSMIKDIFEDHKRYRSDCVENERTVRYIPRGGTEFREG